MTYAAQLEARISKAIRTGDDHSLSRMLDEHYQKAESSQRPYDAAIELKPEYRAVLGAGPFEGALAINWANRISRARRLIVYRKKIAGGFSGERIVEEGDSWFQYPLLLEDIIDNFSDQKDFAVRSLAAAGDLVENMARRKEYRAALTQTGARIMLLSGGGNDLLGEGRLENLLLPYKKGASAKDLIDKTKLTAVTDEIVRHYRSILADVQKRFPHVTIFGHGYDIPFPTENGKYFGKPFAKWGIPLDVGRDIIKIISQIYADRLSKLADSHSNYRFVNLIGSVGNDPRSWDDELHPENAGFDRAAKRMIDAVRKHVETLPKLESDFAADVAEKEDTAHWPIANLSALESASRTVVLDPGHGGNKSLPGASWNNAISPTGRLEKNWTLDVCLRARTLLEAKGYTVLLTRDGDYNRSGVQRRDVARTSGADCFVSVHFNASKNHNAQGTETFIHTEAKSAKSVALMRAVQSAMVSALGHRDRNFHDGKNGVLHASHAVTRESGHSKRTAACLHEVSFMDRIDEDKRLQKASYRNRIAAALAEGVAHYMDGGFESDMLMVEDVQGDYDDAIHARASHEGFTVTQYLGLAEAAPTTGTGASAIVEQDHHIDGSMLQPDAPVVVSPSRMSVVDAILADAREKARGIDANEGITTTDYVEPDAGEGAFIQADDAPDFTKFAERGTTSTAMLEAAFSGLESSGFDYEAFSDFVKGLGLRYFSPGEFLVMGSKNGYGECAEKNTPPAQHLWSNMANTALMIDEIRARLGYPVRIVSAYRSPAYNQCIKGAEKSRHMRFDALDWTCDRGSVDEWNAMAIAVRKDFPVFSGGVGRYYKSWFIHIDTRGYNVEWPKR